MNEKASRNFVIYKHINLRFMSQITFNFEHQVMKKNKKIRSILIFLKLIMIRGQRANLEHIDKKERPCGICNIE